MIHTFENLHFSSLVLKGRSSINLLFMKMMTW